MKNLPNHIYLIDDGEGTVWCNEPAPGVGMKPEDAVKYVHVELFNEKLARINELLKGLESVHDILSLSEYRAENSTHYRGVPRDVALGLEIEKAIKVAMKTMGIERSWMEVTKKEKANG